MQNLRKLVKSELNILLGNEMSSHMQTIGTCTLTLSSAFVLVLERTFYVPSFSRNLIFVSRLVSLGFSFTLKTIYLIYFINQNILQLEF